MINLSLVTLACQVVFQTPLFVQAPILVISPFLLLSSLTLMNSQKEPNLPPFCVCVELPSYILQLIYERDLQFLFIYSFF